MSPNVPLVAGWALVLAGEAWGYHRATPAIDTTSEWIWSLGPIARAVMGIILVVLAAHIAFGWWQRPTL